MSRPHGAALRLAPGHARRGKSCRRGGTAGGGRGGAWRRKRAFEFPIRDALLVEARRDAVTRWTEVQRTYRPQLETLSRTLHPFSIDDAITQTSTQVVRRLHAEVEARAALATRHQFPACHAARSKVRQPLPALAALVDFWWIGVEQDVAYAGLAPGWRVRAKKSLLPRVSWAHHVAHTRCARRKATRRKALEASQAAFDHHMLTPRLPLQALAEWQAWAGQRVRDGRRKKTCSYTFGIPSGRNTSSSPATTPIVPPANSPAPGPFVAAAKPPETWHADVQRSGSAAQNDRRLQTAWRAMPCPHGALL